MAKLSILFGSCILFLVLVTSSSGAVLMNVGENEKKETAPISCEMESNSQNLIRKKRFPEHFEIPMSEIKKFGRSEEAEKDMNPKPDIPSLSPPLKMEDNNAHAQDLPGLYSTINKYPEHLGHVDIMQWVRVGDAPKKPVEPENIQNSTEIKRNKRFADHIFSLNFKQNPAGRGVGAENRI